MNSAGSTQQLPLSGKTIVVTRRKEQAKEFSDLLKQKDAAVLLFPAVEIVEPDSWNDCDSALEQLNHYSGIIFTSSNATEYFFQRVNYRKKSERIKNLAFYAVGETTESTIKKFGFQTERLPDTFSAEELAHTIARTNVGGKRFLFPKGNLAKNNVVTILAKHGAEVDDVVVYNTQEPLLNEERWRRLEEIENHADMITFFSPSSVVHFIHQAERIARIKNVAVIGETTAETARKENLNVVLVAPRSTAAAFADAIGEFYSNK
ncbi:MAG: uroporphyrinogen-III synthase [Ignavibacteriales bacterium]|nr:uroporphyrinogen-III synthase [Ignavibacteriales bacterium]